MKKKAQAITDKQFSKRTKIIILTVLVTPFLYWGIKNWGILTHDTAFTIGRVTETRYVPRSFYDKINYEYSVDGKIFSDESGVSVKREYARCFVGKYFPVVYSTIDTSINELLVAPDDFQRFNVPFPDSLNWVREMLP